MNNISTDKPPVSITAYLYALKYDIKFTMSGLRKYLKDNHSYVDVSPNNKKNKYIYVNPNGHDIYKIVANYIVFQIQNHLNSSLEDDIIESINNNLSIFVDIDTVDKDDDYYVIELV